MTRAVVVSGARTPFCKSWGSLLKLNTIDLGVQAVKGLLGRFPGLERDVGAVVWGGVVLPPHAPNLGREIVLDAGLDPSIEAMTVSRACASGLQAVTCAAQMIERGEAEIVVAGGSDSTSNAAITLPPSFIQKMGPTVMGRSKPKDYLQALAQLSPLSDILPKMPRVAERTTGETMGQSAEKMAARNQITREAQDEFAVRSHHRAARAVESGRFSDEVVAVDVPGGDRVLSDDIIRGDTSAEKLAKLRPVFSRSGTITAGNASPLTDGAAAVLLMSEERAKAEGLRPLAVVRDWTYVGVDPRDQLLIGPALAMPKVLRRAGLSWEQMDRVDMHEAFAAQCLSVMKALSSHEFVQRRVGDSAMACEIDIERLNVHGGSLSIGHPFGATGARMVTTMANELVLEDKQFALLGLCAAGGLAGAAVLERV